jgi:cell division protein FtsN
MLGGAALVILGLTFALGMLVGRQWARQTAPAAAVEPSRRSASAPRRGGLTEIDAERAARPQEKLTFYQTLTAPIGAAPVSVRAEGDPRAGQAPRAPADGGRVPARSDSESVRPGPARAQSPAPPPAEGTPTGQPGTASTLPVAGARATDGRPEGPGDWTIQVGVFRSLPQAESVRRQLAQGGFEAQVTPVGGEAGQARYRVRVGAFPSKDEAARVAERVRATRSLPTYVTPR